MSHQYQRSFSTPDNFHQLLKDFTREVLRDQPANIYEYGFQYFSRIARLQESHQENLQPHYYEQDNINKRNTEINQVVEEDGDEEQSADEETPREEHKNEEVVEDHQQGYDIAELSDHLKETLMDLDKQENGFLSAELVKSVYSQFNFVNYPKLLFMFSELIQTTDEGLIEYIEFIDNSMNMLNDMMSDPAKYESLNDTIIGGENDLVHDLDKNELEEELRAVLSRSDVNQSGKVQIQDFIRELQEAELDLSRREIALVVSHTHIENDGSVVYENILPHMHKLMFIAQQIDNLVQGEEEDGAGDEVEDDEGVDPNIQ